MIKSLNSFIKPIFKTNPKLNLSVLVTLLLLGCSSQPPHSSTTTALPPRYALIDIATIPNPVPRFEPLSPYGNPDEYQVFGQIYHPMHTLQDYTESGIASWYGVDFDGRLTSNREVYHMMDMTAAHRTLPIPCYVRVTNLNNQRWVIVRINDRGPFRKDRVIDLSYTAAKKLGMVKKGTAPVLIESVIPGQDSAPEGDTIKPRYLQIGVYRSSERAKQVIQTLPQSWQMLADTHPLTHQQHTLYAVWLGPFFHQQSVKRLKQQLHDLGYDAWVRTPEKSNPKSGFRLTKNT